MYSVLLPIDGSEERAAAQARMAASPPRAADSVRATVLRVFDDRGTAESTSVGRLTAGQAARDACPTPASPSTPRRRTATPPRRFSARPRRSTRT